MKYLIIMVLLISNAVLGVPDAKRFEAFSTKCLMSDFDASNLKIETVSDSDFVENIEKSIDFSMFASSYDANDLFIQEEKNIHDSSKNYNYIFNNGADGAVFILGKNKEVGKKILACVSIETKKFSNKNIYIGQTFDYFKNRLSLKEVKSIDVLIVEAGDMSVELYFRNNTLIRFHYVNDGYNG